MPPPLPPSRPFCSLCNNCGAFFLLRFNAIFHQKGLSRNKTKKCFKIWVSNFYTKSFVCQGLLSIIFRARSLLIALHFLLLISKKGDINITKPKGKWKIMIKKEMAIGQNALVCEARWGAEGRAEKNIDSYPKTWVRKRFWSHQSHSI